MRNFAFLQTEGASFMRRPAGRVPPDKVTHLVGVLTQIRERVVA